MPRNLPGTHNKKLGENVNPKTVGNEMSGIISTIKSIIENQNV